MKGRVSVWHPAAQVSQMGLSTVHLPERSRGGVGPRRLGAVDCRLLPRPPGLRQQCGQSCWGSAQLP